MLNLNYFVRKRAGISNDQFKEYWLGENAERRMELASKLGIQRITKRAIGARLDLFLAVGLKVISGKYSPRVRAIR